LDRFGAVNDGLGRRCGDLILKEAARRIQERIGPGDTLSRLGGDEFAVLLEDQSPSDDVIRLARRVQEDFRAAFRIEGRDAFLSLSTGIVYGTGEYGSPEEVLRDAGIALGNAKLRGESGFSVFDQAMHDRAVALLGLETELRHAIQKDEFHLHYQPIIDLSVGRVASFEALVRWQHPVRGLVPPMEFIPMAEESSLINDIGRLVLEKACERLRRWCTEHPHGERISMSVNISGKQFRQPNLIDQIRSILAQAGIRPGSLKLEITETAIMDDPKVAAEMLKELTSAGISLQIDDSGTGYSSLSYLHRFPIQALKIDRSFVQPIGENGENAQIASTIVSMARNLGMQVIAEGIETESQNRALREMGCHFGQGFYFSRPLDEPAADALVASLGKPDPGGDLLDRPL
jgi:diguanylate cyclase (GGDEF)-like protein